MEAHWIDLGTHASSVLAFEVAPWKDIEAFKSSDEDGVRWNEHAQRTFTCADIGARWKRAYPACWPFEVAGWNDMGTRRLGDFDIGARWKRAYPGTNQGAKKLLSAYGIAISVMLE